MNEKRILLKYINEKDQKEISIYEKNGGYQAIKQAIGKIPPSTLINMVKDSGLRGRGGAGFVTGMKWSFIPKEATTTYLVCNADESEPGVFKDRLLMEQDPHQLIEGIILAAYAIQAKKAFIYCRGEYFTANHLLAKSIEEAYKKGYLGNNILGSSYSLDIIVHPGAGAYIAGEETAQLNSLEGFRATPRLKPPFPAVSGLYGKPTIVNNVETLCNVVHIINNGVEWYKAIGKPNNTGTKIYQVSGHIQKPGCFEFPLGVSLQEVLNAAGGLFPERSFKACYPGGSSCSLLTKDDLNIELDFDTLAKRGSALGTASIIVMDDTADMVKVAHRLMQFYQNESCGKCTPCREGTRWITQVLERLQKGKGCNQDLPVILETATSMAATSFCPLAVGAAPPVVSAIKTFEAEFLSYIDQNPDKDKLPPMKVSYPYLIKN